MYFQDEYIREQVAMPVTDTYHLDLPENGLLSSLLFRFSADQVKPYGSMGGSWRLIDLLSKILVLGNGATIIKSVTPLEAQALSVWDQGVMPPSVWRNYASNTHFEYILMNFGRKLHDLDYGLDLARFKNVELQITNAMTALLFGTPYVSILGIYLRDAPNNFKGHMRTEEWRSWTTVADETKYLDLPTEHILRRVMLKAAPHADGTTHVADTTAPNLMDDIEFSLDTGAQRVFKGGLDDLARINHYDLGKTLISGGNAYILADYGYDVGFGYVDKIAAGLVSMDGAVHTEPAQISGSMTEPTQVNQYYAGDQSTQFIASGVAPFDTGLIRFDHNSDPSSWLDPERRKTVELNIHTRNSATADDGTNAVILDRLVTY